MRVPICCCLLLLLLPSITCPGQTAEILPYCHFQHRETPYSNPDVVRIWKAMDHLGAKPRVASLLAPIIHEKARQFDVDPLIMVSIARQESSFRLRVRGSKGEIGVFQIMPRVWLEELGFTEDELEDPANNAHACAHILSKYLRKYGDYSRAVKAYNHRVHGARYSKRVIDRYAEVVATL